jgi:hypothetical protein
MRYDLAMRFVGYGPAHVRGVKIDWDAVVVLTDEVVRALHPQELTRLRPGRLRRSFHVKAPRPGSRSTRVVREEITHPKGAMVFSLADQWFLIEAPDE